MDNYYMWSQIGTLIAMILIFLVQGIKFIYNKIDSKKKKWLY